MDVYVLFELWTMLIISAVIRPDRSFCAKEKRRGGGTAAVGAPQKALASRFSPSRSGGNVSDLERARFNDGGQLVGPTRFRRLQLCSHLHGWFTLQTNTAPNSRKVYPKSRGANTDQLQLFLTLGVCVPTEL